MIIVAYRTPSLLVNSMRIFVAMAEAKILTKLFANKIVQINISLFLANSSKFIPFFLVRAKLCIRGFEAEVSEVSDPEKKADNIISQKLTQLKYVKRSPLFILNLFQEI